MIVTIREHQAQKEKISTRYVENQFVYLMIWQDKFILLFLYIGFLAHLSYALPAELLFV